MSKFYQKRIRQLKSSRHNFCKIGTRKVKLRLNRLMEDEPLAKALRLALEAEDNSIKAKAAQFKYGRGHDFIESIYNNKTEQINELLETCCQNGYEFGVSESDVEYPPHIVYVDLPNTDQISYHSYVDEKFQSKEYSGTWDRKRCSTLRKIEKSIVANFPQILN